MKKSLLLTGAILGCNFLSDAQLPVYTDDSQLLNVRVQAA